MTSTTAAATTLTEESTRLSWNALPSSAVEAKKHLVVPLGCVHSALASGAVRLPYEPLVCKGPCRTVLSPYCAVDVRGKLWACPFCCTRNAFPPAYAALSEQSMPAELFPQHSTVEYTMRTPATQQPPVFLFVVDTCLAEAELRGLRDSLVQVIGLLPQSALVGLITFGTTVQVFELSFTACPKAYVFTGTREYTAAKVAELLALPKPPPPSHQATPVLVPNGFVVPLSECEFTLTAILEELQHDPWPVRGDHRPLVCTGTALSVAVGLLESVCKGGAARMMCFIGGPCTQGPGAVVSDDLKELMRSHHDIVKERARHYRKAAKFYEGLAARAANNCHSVDLLCASIDQVGLYEMQELCKRTGGAMVMADAFSKDMFQKTLLQMFEKADDGAMAMAFNGTIEVQTTRELKVCGAIGHVSSLERRSANVSDLEIGIGGTSAWRACGLGPRSSYAFFFEIAGSPSVTAPATAGGQPQQSPGLIQFLTHYQTSTGQSILRVTTIARPWTDTVMSLQPLAESFDQETAAALVARQAAHKLEVEEPYDVLRWADRLLIRLVSKFADYRKDDPTSLRLAQKFTLFPQFMFHLRRSHFVQVFNNSPDESAFYRHVLLRENVSNALVMIQPTLDAYELGAPESTPVLLSATSIATNRILLLDTFFSVVLFLGHDIVQARKEGLADKPEGAAFRVFLAQPLEDAQALIKDRYPFPRYIECAQYSGDARHLLSILDPAITHVSPSSSGGGSEAILTEDVSLQVFIEHLKRAAVQQ
jgi:protein transport protein SEC23